MSERRFTDKPELNPQAVMSLAEDHPAMLENRTLFPSTVVTVTADEPDRLLVSGRNNRKIGATVEKGKFKGYGIYCLSLEERATCPKDCNLRGACYGNGMQMARRHRIADADVFFDRLGFEIVELLDKHPGLLIRLHVLGDFPSAEYVAFWKDVLDEYPNVACFGYTHRSPTTWGGDDIGDVIQSVKDEFPDRFRIRWSSPVARADGAIVVDTMPAGPRTDERALVCPSQTDATACCATCALCWEHTAARECIAFIKHGRAVAEAESVMAAGRKAVDTFEADVVAAMPKLRAQALKLTRKGSDADDLVQETVMKALAKREQFQPGTNLLAWMSTIQRNEFMSRARKGGREIGDAEGTIIGNAAAADDQEGSLDASEVIALVESLPDEQAEALRLIADGVSYEDAAERLGVAVGTIKSRVSRARDMVRDLASGAAIIQRDRDVRAIVPIPTIGLSPSAIRTARPRFVDVRPDQLIVEAKYQRDLSAKSMKLIKRIVERFEWSKFKPPVCVEQGRSYFVIDGQHTAISAASHPDIKTIPIMVVDAASVEDRASAFVAHNRDRVAMSQLQVFHGEVASGKPDAVEILRVVSEAGGRIPRNPVGQRHAKVGDVMSVSEIESIYRAHGAAVLRKIIRVTVEGRCRPISTVVLRAVRDLLTAPEYSGLNSDDLVTALIARPDIDQAARRFAMETNQGRHSAAAVILYRAASALSSRKAA